MAVYKCKMCGGELQVGEDRVAVCGYCGTKQTLPRLDSAEKENLYDRASHFRRNNEFDKATAVYEQILTLDNTDAESYWSLVLCRYGIEYVEDPDTGKRIPTVNRAQFTSVYDDDNYKCAINYADPLCKTVYEEEARTINEIQKGILTISNNEKPFDVFICYKETDSSGRRTHDSVLATELYHELTNEGFRVFFSKITLEDKLGIAYEPYIFAALNSARVMVVLGTKAEYFNAVWVKNEWSRFLSLIKNGEKKILIPAYKNMDPYELPEEFSHLQAQDMNKLGFMQDIIRGIKKMVQPEAKKEIIPEINANINTPVTNTVPLLKRAFMFLEDGDWESADEYCEKVLDMDPEVAEAYLGKLMADLKIKNKDNLADSKVVLETSSFYNKVLRFADDELKNSIISINAAIFDRNEKERFRSIYDKAVRLMHCAQSEAEYKEAAEVFGEILQFSDSAQKNEECLRLAEEARKDAILNSAREKSKSDIIADIERAISLLPDIQGYKDADSLIVFCKNRIDEIVKQEEARDAAKEKVRQAEEKKAKRILIAVCIALFACLIIVATVTINNTVLKPVKTYNSALLLMEDGKYEDAIAVFETLEGYKDSALKINEAKRILRDEKAVETLNTLRNCNVGDYVKFGAYEQDGNTSNGQEDIEWLVLDKKEGKILVISRYGLESKTYNEEYANASWENSTLRVWLNREFLNTAFSEKEKGMIPEVLVKAENNNHYLTIAGNNTMDKVFLFSLSEIGNYFGSVEKRICKPTQHAKGNGAYVHDDACWWWLRFPGENQSFVAFISDDGSFYVDGRSVTSGGGCVRPALWINLYA